MNSSSCIDIAKHNFGTCLVRPPWAQLFLDEGRKINHKDALDNIEEIFSSLKSQFKMKETSHLYIFVPNSIVPTGLNIMKSWGFEYKSNIILPIYTGSYKNFKPKGTEFFKDFTAMVLFGIRGKNARTFDPGRTQVNYVEGYDEIYNVIETCSPGPYLEIFGGNLRNNWSTWNGATINPTSV